MISGFLRTKRMLIVAVCTLFVAACVVVSTTTRSHMVNAGEVVGTQVSAPMKAHLLDGSVVVFDRGATIFSTRVTGVGRVFDASRHQGANTDGVPLDSVVGFEVYERRVNPLRTIVYGSASLAASVVGAVGLAVLLFGSCPTVYADSAGVQTLQAESFSYSIAPMLAKRDVDRMNVKPDSNGVIRLTVRNEALETHHLDHMEIVEVRHRADEIALPSPRGGAIAVSDLVVPSVRDRAGRDVSRIVAKADEIVFTTDSGFLDRAINGGPTDDQLTITIPRRAGVDSVALMMKARSSLLTTSVLYEYLMGRQGALALDFMGKDLSKITTLARLASWYGGNFGMRVEVQDGSEWRPVIRLMDFGPTAWRVMGVALPAVRSADDSVRIRLTFAADAFRIDQLGVAQRVRRAEQRFIPIARVVDAEGKSRPDMVAMLAKADDREVETHPGDQFHIEFDADTASGTSRTFFFAAQGYYVEWLRPAWMKDAATAEPFAASHTTIRDLLRSWRGGRDSLETYFFTRRVPIA
jgi:hypothetical protein